LPEEEEKMQVNIYIPESKRSVIERLKLLAALKHVPFNALALSAWEEYLQDHDESGKKFRVFHLGKVNVERKDLYSERLDRKLRP